MISIKGSFRIVILFNRLWQDIISLIVSISQTHSEVMKSVGKSGMEPAFSFSSVVSEFSFCYLFSQRQMDSLFFGQLVVSYSFILVSCLVVVSLFTDLSDSQLLIQSIYSCSFCLLFPPLFLVLCVCHTWKIFLMLFLTLTFFHYLDIADSSI